MYGGSIVGGLDPQRAYVAAQNAGMLGEKVAVSREVPDQMERLDKAVCYAEESLRELVSRLEYVLRPSAPEVTANQCSTTPGGPMTPHGGHLFHLGTRVGDLGQRMQDVLRRLEV